MLVLQNYSMSRTYYFRSSYPKQGESHAYGKLNQVNFRKTTTISYEMQCMDESTGISIVMIEGKIETCA